MSNTAHLPVQWQYTKPAQINVCDCCVTRELLNGEMLKTIQRCRMNWIVGQAGWGFRGVKWGRPGPKRPFFGHDVFCRLSHCWSQQSAGFVLIRVQANTSFSSCFIYVGQGNYCYNVAFSFVEIFTRRRINHKSRTCEWSEQNQVYNDKKLHVYSLSTNF